MVDTFYSGPRPQGNQMSDPVRAIPPPNEIKDRLTALARERALLRDLLRLSLRRERELQGNGRAPELAMAK